MAATGGDDATGWRDKLDRFSTWRTELSEEAALLPQTLAELRTTISDLRKVSARLELATQGLETALKLAETSGIAPMARQLDSTANEIEAQMRTIREQMPAGDLMGKAVSDLQKTVDAFTSLLPRSRSDRSARPGSQDVP
jgi:prefoldin subunit 5